MLGEKIYFLRKERNISQEKFAEILNTSRQAVSKWERNEAKPDIDKIILIARLFNVSVDYLLSYEINNYNIDDYINKLEECCKNNNFILSINDIKLWCSKYSNNFKLHVMSADYLFGAYIENNHEEYLDLALSYIKKAIMLYAPEYHNSITLNELHGFIPQIYLMQHKYELAKDYVENNNLYDCDVLLAKCEYALGKYENALEISSKIYLNSIFNIVNVSLIQIMILLKKQEIQEAYELVNWTIQFINSVKNEESFFKGVLCPFIYFKAACEKLLNLSVDESINKLKAITEDCLDLNIISKAKTLKYYFGNLDEVIFIDCNIKNTFLEVIHQTDNNDVHYQVLIDIYKEIFKGDANE